MRYRGYERPVNIILDLARAARQLEATFEGNPSSADFTQHLAEAAGEWAESLVDIILDHEERQARFREHWRRWRKARRTAYAPNCCR